MSSRNQQPLSNIGLFYKQLDDFKEKLVHILTQFGKEKEIVELHKYYDKLMTFKKVNVRTPIELFYQYCVVLAADDILTRDASFFIGEFSKIDIKQDGEQDQTEVNGLDKVSGLEKLKVADKVTKKDIFFIAQIRDVWNMLQPNVKNNIWDYIQVICLLSEKIVGSNVIAQRREVLMKEGKIH